MDWLIQRFMENDTVIAAGLTFVMSVFGAKTLIAKRINTVFVIAKETLDVIGVLAKIMKPDEDGKVKIDRSELEELRKEAAELKKVINSSVALR